MEDFETEARNADDKCKRALGEVCFFFVYYNMHIFIV